MLPWLRLKTEANLYNVQCQYDDKKQNPDNFLNSIILFFVFLDGQNWVLEDGPAGE